MKERKRIPTDGDPAAWKSPFAALQQVELPPPFNQTGRSKAPAGCHP